MILNAFVTQISNDTCATLEIIPKIKVDGKTQEIILTTAAAQLSTKPVRHSKSYQTIKGVIYKTCATLEIKFKNKGSCQESLWLH